MCVAVPPFVANIVHLHTVHTVNIGRGISARTLYRTKSNQKKNYSIFKSKQPPSEQAIELIIIEIEIKPKKKSISKYPITNLNCEW